MGAVSTKNPLPNLPTIEHSCLLEYLDSPAVFSSLQAMFANLPFRTKRHICVVYPHIGSTELDV